VTGTWDRELEIEELRRQIAEHRRGRAHFRAEIRHKADTGQITKQQMRHAISQRYQEFLEMLARLNSLRAARGWRAFFRPQRFMPKGK
jgi:hypothetical protein